MPDTLTAEAIGEIIASLDAKVAKLVQRGERLEAVIMVLLDRVGDTARVTIAEAVAIERRLYGKGSVAGVRKKVHDKKYTLEKRGGEKEARIPIDQIYDGYLPIETWRKALEAQKRGR